MKLADRFLTARRYLIAAAACSATIASSGCGDDTDSTAPTRSDTANTTGAQVQPPNLVSAARVRDAKSGPQRGLLNWWRAVQFSDTETALRLTSASAIGSFDGGMAAFREAVRDVGASLPGIALNEAVAVNSRRTAVRAFIEFYDERGRATARTPRTFLMTRSGKGWRLGDASYLEDQADAIQKARKNRDG